MQAVELELSTHVTAVLDAAHSGYKLSDNKALDILRSLDTLGGIQMSYQALVTSWIGRYLKTLHLLLLSQKDKSVGRVFSHSRSWKR